MKTTNKLKIPLSQRLFHLVGAVRSQFILRAFESDARRARALNLETLRDIVTLNKDTEFGRTYGFAQMDLLENDADYVAAVPIHTYNQLEPYVERMAKGEPNVLSAEMPSFFALSSGTSGHPKLVPTTPSLQQTQVRYYSNLLPSVASQHIQGGGEPHRGALVLSGARSGMKTASGTPIDTASSAGVLRMKKIMPYLWTTPFEALIVSDHDAGWYLHALFALRERETKFIQAAFSPMLVGWLTDIEQNWDSLIEDIAKGTLTSSIQLTEQERANLQQHLRADPTRAAELRATVVDGFANFVPRVWPHIRYAACIITGSFAAYLPNLRYYIGPDLPVYTTLYIASEAVMGINLWPDQPEHYALTVGSAAFEFIPAEYMEEETPPTVSLAELEVGQEYEIVLTNLAGFYRYRLTDVVKVVDFFHELPVISFSYRRGDLLDLVGERLTQQHTLDAVQGFVQSWGGKGATLVDYTVTHDTNCTPPRYVFYIEVKGAEGSDPSDAWQHMDTALINNCHPYRLWARAKRHVDVPKVKLMKPGAFETLIAYRMSKTKGSSRNQLKIPRVLNNSEHLDVLEQHVLVESEQSRTK